MASKPSENDVEALLKYLLAIELWRGGLTQKQIAKALKISGTKASEMLKGVSRNVASGGQTNN